MFIRSTEEPVLVQVVGHSEHGDAYCCIITMALDGKLVIKKLQCTTLLFYPSLRWYVRTPQDQHRWCERHMY